jgi:ubiquitin carboxyl-terminal hydrolase L5
MDTDLDQQHPQPSGSHVPQSPLNVGQQIDLVGGTFAVIESDPGQHDRAHVEFM